MRSGRTTPQDPHFHPRHPTPGVTLPRRTWVRLNCLRTGVGRFRSCLYKWGMASSAACVCGAEEQTVDHVVLRCPIHRPPNGLHGPTALDDERQSNGRSTPAPRSSWAMQLLEELAQKKTQKSALQNRICPVGYLRLFACEHLFKCQCHSSAFHFRCIRSILGVSWRDRIPNTTIMEITGAPDIFSLLRIYRLRWRGHVCRMEDGRLPKDILYGQPVGRPKLRYIRRTTCRSSQTPLQGRTEKRFKGTQHKYRKLGTIDTGACSLALPSARQTSIFDPNVHHRLQSSPN